MPKFYVFEITKNELNMNSKTLRNLFFILFCILLLSGCEEEEWTTKNIEGSCWEEYPTNQVITEKSGQIISMAAENDTHLILIVEEDFEYYAMPCNLPSAFQKDGLMVKFDAEFKQLPTSEPIDTLADGTIQYITWDYIGTPCCLTALEVKE